jgi:hypothetical protein
MFMLIHAPSTVTLTTENIRQESRKMLLLFSNSYDEPFGPGLKVSITKLQVFISKPEK